MDRKTGEDGKSPEYLAAEAALLRKVRESFSATFPGFDAERIRPAKRYGNDDPAVLIDGHYIITSRGNFGWDTLPPEDPNPKRYWYDLHHDYLSGAIEQALTTRFQEDVMSMPNDVDDDTHHVNTGE